MLLQLLDRDEKSAKNRILPLAEIAPRGARGNVAVVVGVWRLSLKYLLQIQSPVMVLSNVPPDRSKIAIDHPDEVKYWSKHLGITPDELRRLVDKVGNSAAAVTKELRLGNMDARKNS